jgi:hypothetical protein
MCGRSLKKETGREQGTGEVHLKVVRIPVMPYWWNCSLFYDDGGPGDGILLLPRVDNKFVHPPGMKSQVHEFSYKHALIQPQVSNC